MFQMNAPKYLWNEAVLTTMYLINRMPSRILGIKPPAELLLGQREFKLPPRVFGCVCFVRDHRPSIEKLDPQAVKCIFVGYSSTQKGYKCWDPVGRKLFVSMDVTFREFEPYYTNKCDIDQFLEEFSLVNESDSREGENSYMHSGDGTQERVITGGTFSSPQDEMVTHERMTSGGSYEVDSDDIESNEVQEDNEVMEDSEVVEDN
jgi:hypothetical protein